MFTAILRCDNLKRCPPCSIKQCSAFFCNYDHAGKRLLRGISEDNLVSVSLHGRRSWTWDQMSDQVWKYEAPEIPIETARILLGSTRFLVDHNSQLFRLTRHLVTSNRIPTTATMVGSRSTRRFIHPNNLLSPPFYHNVVGAKDNRNLIEHFFSVSASRQLVSRNEHRWIAKGYNEICVSFLLNPDA